jgi:hypothetical protein
MFKQKLHEYLHAVSATSYFGLTASYNSKLFVALTTDYYYEQLTIETFIGSLIRCTISCMRALIQFCY